MISRQLRSAIRVYSRHLASICNKLTIIGGGNMAEGYLRALKSNKIQDMTKVTVVDIHDDRLSFLKETYGVQVSQDVNESVKESEIILLCCKPQNVETVASDIIKIPPNAQLVSIVAGVPVSYLSYQFKTNKIVRCMPNTPASILEGMTVWYATNESDPEQIKKSQSLLESTGDAIRVTQENFLDMATAVSGSGPAYVFLTMEAMIDAAVHVGFPRNIATKLVVQTIKVTSPGGTTASALYELEKGGFRTVVADAIWAAYRRSLELGGRDSNIGPGRSKSVVTQSNNDKSL